MDTLSPTSSSKSDHESRVREEHTNQEDGSSMEIEVPRVAVTNIQEFNWTAGQTATIPELGLGCPKPKKRKTRLIDIGEVVEGIPNFPIFGRM